MIRINVHLALASLRAAKLRSLLTMVAVIIGVSSFVVVTSTVDGLRTATVTEINGLGGNLVSVLSGDVIVEDAEGNESLGPLGSEGDATLTPEDLEDIASIEGVEAIAPFHIIQASVSRDGVEQDRVIVGATNEQYPAAFNHQVAEGNFLSDKSATGRFAVVGTGIVEGLFAGELSLGSRIEIKGESFTIIGVMEEQSNTFAELFNIDQNNSVFISSEQGERLSGLDARFAEIDLQLSEDTDPNEVIPQIEELVLENHNGEEDFSVLTQDQLVGLIDSLLGTIKVAGQLLRYIMLFVASIVILLIMLITVRERTREIGIRKSIGATNNNILIQFLTEAVVISWVGSFIGLCVGFGLGFIVRSAADLTPVYSLNTLIVLVIISTAVGVIAGVGPAWSAARRDPVESLRHE